MFLCLFECYYVGTEPQFALLGSRLVLTVVCEKDLVQGGTAELYLRWDWRWIFLELIRHLSSKLLLYCKHAAMSFATVQCLQSHQYKGYFYHFEDTWLCSLSLSVNVGDFNTTKLLYFFFFLLYNQSKKWIL